MVGTVEVLLLELSGAGAAASASEASAAASDQLKAAVALPEVASLGPRVRPWARAHNLLIPAFPKDQSFTLVNTESGRSGNLLPGWRLATGCNGNNGGAFSPGVAMSQTGVRTTTHKGAGRRVFVIAVRVECSFPSK